MFDLLQKMLCGIGLHAWKRTRRGNRFYCADYRCKAERDWKKSDK